MILDPTSLYYYAWKMAIFNATTPSIFFSQSESEAVELCPTLCGPIDCSLQASPSMGFSGQEYWSGLPFLSPGDLPDPGIEPRPQRPNPGLPPFRQMVLPSEPFFSQCKLFTCWLEPSISFSLHYYTHGFLFYSRGSLSPSLLILKPRFSQIWPVRAPSNWLLCPFDILPSF